MFEAVGLGKSLELLWRYVGPFEARLSLALIQPDEPVKNISIETGCSSFYSTICFIRGCTVLSGIATGDQAQANLMKHVIKALLLTRANLFFKI